MLRARHWLTSLSVAAVVAMSAGRAASGRADTATSSDQAIDLAKKTGRPVLAIAGSET